MTEGTRKVHSDVLSLTRQVLWSNSLNGVLGRILGALSFLALARYAFNFGLSAAAAAVFEYYDRLLRVLLGWVDPYLESLIVGTFARLDIHVAFNDYWRHVFVVLQLLFARDAGVAFTSGRRSVGVVRLGVGFVVAVIFSTLAAVSLPGAQSLFSNLVFATLPTVGIYVYDAVMYGHAAFFQLKYLNEADATPGRSPGRFLGTAMTRASLRLAIGLLVSYAAFLFPVVRDASVPAGGLVAIGLATLANASYWLWRGARYASKRTHFGREWVDAFGRSEAGRFGVAISGVIVWAIIFATMNAGMQRVGL